MESLQRVLEIANRVNGTASKVEINQHQCRRLAKVFDEVGKSIKLLIVANEDAGQQSAEIDALDALLHVFESGELLVLEYAGPNWFRNLMISQDNKEAFEEVYDDLRDIMDYMFGIPFDKMYYPLTDDAAQDQQEMVEKLYGIKSQQSRMVGTSTANFETSSELEIQSYSLDIALTKLNQGRAAPVKIVPFGYYGGPNYDEAEIIPMPDSVEFGRPVTRYLRRTRKSEEDDDIRVEEFASESVYLSVPVPDAVGDDIRYQESSLDDLLSSCKPVCYSFGPSVEMASSVYPSAPDVAGVDIRCEKPSFEADDVGNEESAFEAVYLRIEPSKIKLGKFLGEGSYSEVRVAEWADCECAVKILKAPDVMALRTEVRIHEKLRHPHIVQLIGFSEDKDKCMILMDLMEGDLHTHIASQRKGTSRKQPFSLLEAVDLMKQIAAGMQFLHSKNIVHGDLKPRNVLLMGRRDRVQLKITDFGVSQEKLVKAREGVYEASGFSGKVGSGWYRAPEILKSITLNTEAKYSGKADVYSFAMTAYEILTGLAPFENKATTRKDVVDGERPELPPQLNLTLKQLVERCWDDDQDVRPSFEEICRDLKSLALSPEVDMWKQWHGIFSMRSKAKAK